MNQTTSQTDQTSISTSTTADAVPYAIDPDLRERDASSSIGIDPETDIASECPVFTYSVSDGLIEVFRTYDSDPDNNISLGNVEQKAEFVFEVLKRTDCVLVEIEPWFVNTYMGDDEFDRWEPFCIGFPETSLGDRQVKLTNLAPVSEIAYRLSQRDAAPDTATAVSEEYRAMTRYDLPAVFNGEDASEAGPDQCGARIDMKPIKAFHRVPGGVGEHLLVGSRDDGSLYCGRGMLTDDHVDIQIGLGWRENEYGEAKVAVYNDESTKAAMSGLSFQETHARYLGEKERWEVDLDAIETVIEDVLQDQSVSFVAMHRVTEEMYRETCESRLEDLVEGYPLE